MLPSFCKDTVMRIRPGSKEVRGSVIPDWEKVDLASIRGCSMQPASTTLSEDGRVLGIQDRYTLFAPSGADIIAGDRIQFQGKTYEIDGDVRVQPGAMRLDHLEITLKRYSG